jgi:hypothetical protein
LNVKTNFPFLQVLHDAGPGIQPKSASTGQKDTVGFLDQVNRLEQVRLPGPRGTTPHIDPHGGPRFGNDYGNPGGSRQILSVPHLQAFNVGKWNFFHLSTSLEFSF